MPEKYADPAVYAALKDVYQTYASTQEFHESPEASVNRMHEVATIQDAPHQPIADRAPAARKECDPKVAAAQVFQIGRDIAVLRNSASSAQVV